MSFEQAMNRIAGVLGWDGMARELGLTESAVRKRGDPDSPGSLTFEEALRLDTAYGVAGGDGYPLHQTYALRLQLSADDARSSAVELVRAAGRAARETGEAVEALLAASEPGADAFTRQTATREGQEAIEALTSAVSKVGAGLIAANTGGAET
jgi:hypothetical protein